MKDGDEPGGPALVHPLAGGSGNNSVVSRLIGKQAAIEGYPIGAREC